MASESLSNTYGPTNPLHLRDDGTFRMLVAATAVLFVTALLGPFLTVATVGGFSIFVFRLYLPVYILILGRCVRMHGYSLSRLRSILTALPMPVWLLFGLGVYTTASAPFYTDLGRMLFELFTLLTGVFVGTMIVITTDSRSILKHYFAVLFALVICAEMIAFWEIFTDSHLRTSRLLVKQIQPEYARIGFDAASAWFHNQNNFSWFLALTVGPMSAYGLVPNPNRPTKRRALGFVIVALAALIVWANRSRLALISILLTVSIITTLVFVRPRIRPWVHTQEMRVKVASAVLLGGTACFLLFLLVPNPFPESSLSLWKRWQLGAAGSQLLVDSYGLGVGVGNAQSAVATGPIATRHTGELHNWLLYLASSYGIVGSCLFLVAYATLLYDLGVKAINAVGWVEVGLFGMLLVFPLNTLGPSNAVMTHSFWIFIYLAIAAAYRIPRIPRVIRR